MQKSLKSDLHKRPSPLVVDTCRKKRRKKSSLGDSCSSEEAQEEEAAPKAKSLSGQYFFGDTSNIVSTQHSSKRAGQTSSSWNVSQFRLSQSNQIGNIFKSQRRL